MKTIALTGATGFLGSHVFKRLIREGYDVIVFKQTTSNLRRIETEIGRARAVYDVDRNGVDQAFSEREIDVVLHCATDYGRKNADPLRIVRANLILPLSLLEIGRRRGLKAFINTDTLLDKRVSDYSLSKRQFVEWLRSHGTELIAANVALEHFYGPDDDPSKFLSWTLDSILAGRDALPLTAGEQKRDFIFIDDVVEAFSAIWSNLEALSRGFHHFEVGSGRSVPIKDVVSRISDLCQPHATRLDFGALPYRPNEVMESKANLDRLFSLGWRPQVDLEEGLERTVRDERALRGLPPAPPAKLMGRLPGFAALNEKEALK